MTDRPSLLRPPAVEDHDQLQAVVLDRVLDCLPIHLTVEELVRELAEDPSEFGPRNQVENAIRDLVETGLAYRHGPFVFPSRAASRAAVLFDQR